MNFENKNTNNRPSSKIKTINPNNNYKENVLIQKKKGAMLQDLKKELADAENFLEKANKEYMNYKAIESKKEKSQNNPIDEAAIKFIEKTLEEKNMLKRPNIDDNKIPLKQFLKENSLASKSPLENHITYTSEYKNSVTTSVAITNNNLENTNFDNGFYLSNPSKENLNLQKRETNEKLNPKDFKTENTLLTRYKKQLKVNGFPDIGNIYCLTEYDQELLFKFFDYILIKKSNENGDKLKLKKMVKRNFWT